MARLNFSNPIRFGSHLFRLIHEEHPELVYDLAKIFDRDLSYVSKEVSVLESLGFIKLQKENQHSDQRRNPTEFHQQDLQKLS
jgi:predicted transcriptional regulator